MQTKHTNILKPRNRLQHNLSSSPLKTNPGKENIPPGYLKVTELESVSKKRPREKDEIQHSKKRRLKENMSELDLRTSVKDNVVIQEFALESLSMGTEHTKKTKVVPIENDDSSEDSVHLISAAAISRLNESLLNACSTGDLIKCKRLIAQGAKINTKNNLGMTPLIAAIDHDNFPISEDL